MEWIFILVILISAAIMLVIIWAICRLGNQSGKTYGQFPEDSLDEKKITLTKVPSWKDRLSPEEKAELEQHEREERQKILEAESERRIRKLQQKKAQEDLEEAEAKRKDNNTKLAMMFMLGAAWNELGNERRHKENTEQMPRRRSHHLDFDEVEDDDYW